MQHDEFDPWAGPAVGLADEELVDYEEGPNLWIPAAIGCGLLVVVGLLLFVVFRAGRSNGPQLAPTAVATASTTAATSPVPSAGPAAPSGSAASGARGPLVSSVTITPTVAPAACLGTPPNQAAKPLEAFLNAALSQQGTPYEYGAKAKAGDANPRAFDTSGLVKWSLAQAGVVAQDGSWIQYLDLADCGATLPVAQALTTPGALVFGFSSEPRRDLPRPDESFVAISFGDGKRVIDVSQDHPVAVVDATTRRFTHAATIPDIGQGTLSGG